MVKREDVPVFIEDCCKIEKALEALRVDVRSQHARLLVDSLLDDVKETRKMTREVA